MPDSAHWDKPQNPQGPQGSGRYPLAQTPHLPDPAHLPQALGGGYKETPLPLKLLQVVGVPPEGGP